MSCVDKVACGKVWPQKGEMQREGCSEPDVAASIAYCDILSKHTVDVGCNFLIVSLFVSFLFTESEIESTTSDYYNITYWASVNG